MPCSRQLSFLFYFLMVIKQPDTVVTPNLMGQVQTGEVIAD